MNHLLHLKEDLSEQVRYDYAEYPIYIRRALLSAYPNYMAPSHWHDAVEFIVVLSGEMQYNVNGKIIHLQSGEGIFVNARQMHFGFSDTHMECDFICVLLHPVLLCNSVSIEQTYIKPLMKNQHIPYLKMTKEENWHNSILQDIRQIYVQRNSMAAPLKVQSFFASAWATIFENTSNLNNMERMPNNSLTVIKNMIGFIQQNYREKILLADIAKSGAVGQSKCCKLFSEYLGQTPIHYLMVYRLDKSIELLQNTDLTISEIAFEVGFGGASYYAESFRKWMGQSPTKYKSKLRRS